MSLPRRDPSWGANARALPAPRGATTVPPAVHILRPDELSPRLVKVVGLFLSRHRNANTRANYLHRLKLLARFLQVGDPLHAAALLLSQDPLVAQELAQAFHGWEIDRGCSAGTARYSVVVLASLATFARRRGEIHWHLDPADRPSRRRTATRRQVRGPSAEVVADIIARLSALKGVAAARNLALFRLLADLGLRASEACELTLRHLDLGKAAISIIGKGRMTRETLTLPPATIAALQAWLAVRGAADGPLFMRLKGAGTVQRLFPDVVDSVVPPASRWRHLDKRAVFEIVRAAGRRAGLKLSPHMLRHTAITTALDVTGGNLRAVAAFSRHMSIQTVLTYDDGRADHQSDLALKVSEAYAQPAALPVPAAAAPRQLTGGEP